MKRTPIKWGTKRLKTYSPLRPMSEKRKAQLLDAGLLLTSTFTSKLPEGGAPRRRSRGPHRIPGDVREVVRERSEGWCEIQLSGCAGRASQMHHRVTQKDGGRHGAALDRSDRPSNLLDACWFCHHVVTESPGASKQDGIGWSLEEWQEPLQELVLYRGDLSYIDDAGGVHSFEKAGA